MEEEVYTEQNLIKLAVNISCVRNIREINAAIFNCEQEKFSVTQFQDNEHYSDFEFFLFQVNLDHDYSKFNMIINFPELLAEKGIL